VGVIRCPRRSSALTGEPWPARDRWWWRGSWRGAPGEAKWGRRRRGVNSEQMSGNAFSFRNCSACGIGSGDAAAATMLDLLQELSNVGEARKNRELTRGGFLWPDGDTALRSPASSTSKCV